MPRPLMQHGVGKLEEMFAKGTAAPKVLEQLEEELQHRHVPRAVALLAEVQAAISGMSPAMPARPAPEPAPAQPIAPQQPTLWELPAASSSAVVTAPMAPPRPENSSRPFEAATAEKPVPPPVPTMPLEDAYKLLKATPSSTWESIEQTRRQLVQPSYPERLKSMSPDRRAQALAEAMRVNAAYASLSKCRCGVR